MKVRAINDYFDLEKQALVVAGTVFEVADARGKALSTTANKSGTPLVEVVEVTTPPTEKVAKVTKKTAKK